MLKTYYIANALLLTTLFQSEEQKGCETARQDRGKLLSVTNKALQDMFQVITKSKVELSKQYSSSKERFMGC